MRTFLKKLLKYLDHKKGKEHGFMITKTELLEKLTANQLKEIAITENVQLPKGVEKDEIIRRLLKLPLKRIRYYVTEYTEEDKREGRADSISEPITDLGVRIQDLVYARVKAKLNKAMQEPSVETPGASPRAITSPTPGKDLESRVEEKHEPAESVVSEVLPDRIRTGYEDLDNLLFGGIPKNFAVILTAGSCDERELLIKRFLETGAKEGQITFHVTIEASDVKTLAEEFQSNFYLFICNPQANAVIKKLPNVFELKGVDNLNEINIALTSAFRKLDASLKGPRRACIEIISDALLQHHAPSIRKWLAALIPELKSRGFTVLAVMNPFMHPSEEVQAIQDLFEGEISIFQKEARKGSQKYLRITKLYNQRYLENESPLRKEKLK